MSYSFSRILLLFLAAAVAAFASLPAALAEAGWVLKTQSTANKYQNTAAAQQTNDSQASFSSQTLNSGQPAPAEVQQKVEAFLERFIDPEKTAAEQAALFSDPVEYYEHGFVGPSEIIKDVKRFQRHWTYRKYWLAEKPHIVMDTVSGRVFVTYTIGFAVANNTRSIAGQANYGAVIRNIDSAPKIEWIKENVIRRKAGTALSGN